MPQKKKTARAAKTKAPAKRKPAAKNKMATAKPRAKRKVMASVAEPAGPDIPTPPEPDLPGPEAGCSDCGHLPFKANALAAVLASLVIALSVTVLASVMSMNSQQHQLKAYADPQSVVR